MHVPRILFHPFPLKSICRGGGRIVQTAVNPPTEILTRLESTAQSFFKAAREEKNFLKNPTTTINQAA